MEYEFANIESLIRSAFEQTKSSLPFDERFAQIRNAVAAERDRIKQTFALRFWALDSDQYRRNYFQYHAQALTFLIDDLFEISLKSDSGNRGKQDRKAKEAFFLYDLLQDILSFLQAKFPEYHDLNSKLPEPHSQKVVAIISDRLAVLRQFQTTNPSPAITTFEKSLRSLLEKAIPRLTYRMADYLQSVTAAIQEHLTANTNIQEAEIQSLLLSQNFNTEEFLNLAITSMQAELKNADSDIARLELVAFQLKEINQAPEHTEFAFNPSFKSIKVALADWILEEQHFLERKKDLSTVSQATEKEFTSKGFKLEFDLSVSQFAFLIKALVETGIIQNKNLSELIRFLAKFVKTKRSENISYESFRMKYYNVESATKEAVRNLLHNAIAFINSN